MSETTATVIELDSKKRRKKSRAPKVVTSGITDKGLTLIGEFAPLIRTSELADWLNYANGGRSNWTSDRVRDLLTKLGALHRLPEDENYEGSARRPKPKTSRRTFYTTLDSLAEKAPEFYQCLIRAADADVLERMSGVREI